MYKIKKYIFLFLLLTIAMLTIACNAEEEGEASETDQEADVANQEDTNLVDNGVPTTDRDRPMRILLINDDGYKSIGIKQLQEQLEIEGYDVWTVAPIENQSGAGTSIQFDDKEHELLELGDQHYAFEGTPTDNFKVAINVLMDEKPDLVISGVNDGPNYGEVQMNSGTVAGAARAVRHGYPAIAASLDWLGSDESELETYMPPAVDYVVNMVNILNEEWQAGDMMMPLGTGLSINYPAKAPEEIEGVQFIENEGIYTDFQHYEYDEEKEGIYPKNDLEKIDEMVADENLNTDLTVASRGYVTVSAIDGNWNAEEEKVEYMEDMLGDLEAN